jgi:hypothetical protein
MTGMQGDFPADDDKHKAAQNWNSAAVGRAPKRSARGAAKKFRKGSHNAPEKLGPGDGNSIERPPISSLRLVARDGGNRVILEHKQVDRRSHMISEA